MKIGQVVKSVAGRDKGNLLVVTANRPEGLFVADGKARPLERAKLRNQKHIMITGYCLKENEYCTNRALRSALRQLNANEMNSERGQKNV